MLCLTETVADTHVVSDIMVATFMAANLVLQTETQMLFLSG
jgi:hypothetical protein